MEKDLYMKKEKIELELEFSEKEAPASPKADVKMEHQKNDLSLANDHMSQTICMFRKYLLSKTQNKMGKTNKEESQVIKKRPARPFLPPKFGSTTSRHASALEQAMFPVFRCNAMKTQSPCDCKSPAAQLTIFYAGAIHVYDNVSIEKAHAIMLLAGESCQSKPVATELPKTEVNKPVQHSNSTTVCKLQADLPIARKVSLQHFLEKRRRRITNRSPYSPTSREHKETDQSTKMDGKDRDCSISLAPFPSRLGYFFPVSTKEGRSGRNNN